ncbi:MAG: hypothetical protein ABIN67_20055, partial [Ferruginibacter sp.]
MKKLFKILLVIIIAGAIGGFIYWQYQKKKIIKDSIDNTIAKKTDSLYFIQYDSSAIDEINGNASFYNVVLQSDDEQKKLLNSTDSLPNALYNIKINEIAARGVDMAGLLQKENVAAKKILLMKPVIQIINTGNDKPKPFTMDDTLALYKKILGKFKSIQADTIQVINGSVLITNKAGKAQTTLENINITLRNFLVDSTKNYESIISYFIKDVRLTVDNIQLPPSKNDIRINIEKLDYDAARRSLKVGAVKQYKANNMNPVSDLRNIHISDLNTDAFIIQERLKAGEITCDGGLITVYTKKKTGSANKGNQAIELSSDVIDQAQIAGINLGNTKVIIINKDQPNAPPLVLSNARFKVLTPVKIIEGTTVNNIINNAQWEFSGDGFSFDTKDRMYKLSVKDFVINNLSSTVKVRQFSVKPLLTEQQFVKQSRYQHDLYDLTINDMTFSGVNIKKLLVNKELEIESGSIQTIFKIFNDKTLPPQSKSKVGNYPHQLLQKVSFPIYIKTLKITNGQVSYRERAAKSAMVGNVFFTGLNGTLSNITNIPDRLKSNPNLTVKAGAKFLGQGNLSTLWQLPMNTSSGAFNIKGEMQPMNAVGLNPLIEPLGMASVKQGQVDKVTFNMDGTNLKAVGNILFLYHDLKLELLKKDEDEKQLKKKGLMSALANTIIKNDNTNTDNSKQVNYTRDTTRSFFN